MPLAQMRLVAMARKHGAKLASASAMHGWARFVAEADAIAFAETMSAQLWSVTVYHQADTETTRVDWTAERNPNGQHINVVGHHTMKGNN